jgi:hypothetical protein
VNTTITANFANMLHRWLTHYSASKEIIMAMIATRHSFGSHKSRWTATAVLSLLVVAALGCIAVVPVEYAPPQVNKSSWFALENKLAGSEPATERVESQAATGVAPAAVPAGSAAQRNFDYFPDHYVIQATKIEAPIATF